MQLNWKEIEFTESSDLLFTYYFPSSNEVNFNDETYLAIKKLGKGKETHIQIQPDLQRNGFALEIIKSFIYQYGYIEFRYGRITNENLYRVFQKIEKDSWFIIVNEDTHISIDER